MKRVLITGGAGFVGTNLIKLFLKRTNYKIISLDDYSSEENLELLKKNKDFITNNALDVVNLDI